MRYEIVEMFRVGWNRIYKIKCIPNRIARFFGVNEFIKTIIFKGEHYLISGKKVFYDIYGNKIFSDSITNWLNIKLKKDNK